MTPDEIRAAELERDRLLQVNRSHPASAAVAFNAEVAALRDENAKLRAEVERLTGISDRANKAMEKHQKHNGALEIAIQEAHRDTDAVLLQVRELKDTLEWVKRYHASSSPFGHAGCGFCEKLVSVEKPKSEPAGTEAMRLRIVDAALRARKTCTLPLMLTLPIDEYLDSAEKRIEPSQNDPCTQCYENGTHADGCPNEPPACGKILGVPGQFKRCGLATGHDGGCVFVLCDRR